VLELVKWSFTLPIVAILLSLAARWVASIFHSIFEITVPAISGHRDDELFMPRGHAEIARLRPRNYVR
jgi:hypothetical protein